MNENETRTAGLHAAELVRRLELAPHPLGGFHREVFRSAERVMRADGTARSALTTHLVLLPAGAVRRWHRTLGTDAVWQHHAGAPFELFEFTAGTEEAGLVVVGPILGGLVPLAVVPAGKWQAARSLGEWSLCACTYGPGLDPEDLAALSASAPSARPAPPAALSDVFGVFL